MILTRCSKNGQVLSLISSCDQARSQAEARKPGLQHHLGIDMINPGFEFSCLRTTKGQTSLRISAV